MNVSVVIPVYQSMDTLVPLTERLGTVLATVAERFEVVFVDDCSQDSSWETIKSLAQRVPWVRGQRLSKNFGQHNALLCGIHAAQYEIIVTLDDDLQNPPEEIPKLLAKLAEGHDVVYGRRTTLEHGLLRNLTSALTKHVMARVMGVSMAHSISPFRAFHTRLRQGFSGYNGPYVSIDVLLSWSTRRFAAVDVRHEARTVGTSHYGLRRLIAHALNMICGFSALPLRLATVAGFTSALAGLALLSYVVIRFLVSGGSVPGFPFLASTVVTFSGIQLAALGVIGEYLARMHFRIMDKPAYVVEADARAESCEAHP
jgi:glycosyltransferase involved in cell wall biosynthesis